MKRPSAKALPRPLTNDEFWRMLAVEERQRRISGRATLIAIVACVVIAGALLGLTLS